MAAIGLLGAFGLTACEPSPAETALKLTLTDTGAGAPAENVTVSVFPAADSSAPATADGISDADGNVWFTHGALPAGSYVVRFGSPPTMYETVPSYPRPGSENARWYNGAGADAATDRSGAVTIEVLDDAPADLVESYSVPRGHMDGDLYQRHNGGVKDVTATLYAVPSGKIVATATTDSAGHFEFSGVPAQDYKVRFAKSGWTTIWAGPKNDTAYSFANAAAYSAMTGDNDDTLVDHYVVPESTITGTVTDGTNPVSGEIVIAYFADSNRAATFTTTAADGTFTLHGLSGFGYKLAFVTPGNTFAPMVLGAGTGPGASLSLDDGSTFSLQTGGTLSLGEVPLTQGADCTTAQAASGTTADLGSADLHNCNLSTADLTDTQLQGANLSGANLATATLPDSLILDPSSSYGDLSNADLSNANLSQAEPPSGGYTDMGGADLSGADLSHADMTSSVMDGSDLTGANLSHANLSYGTIDGSKVSGADLSSTTFLYTMTMDLSWSTPPTLPAGYKFVGSTLLGAGVGMNGVDLSGADLSGMDLSRLWLTSTNLSGADLSDSTLTNISWNVVDLSGANLAGATLSVGYAAHLTHDENTVLPEGWDIVDGTFVSTSP